MLLARDVHAYAAGTNPAEYNQPCDSITVCNAGDDGLTCPEGMHEVASPTRSDVYHIRGGEGEGAVADDPRGAPLVRTLPPLVHFPPRSASLALTPVHSRSLPRVRAWPNGDDHDLGHDQEHSADAARWTSFVLL